MADRFRFVAPERAAIGSWRDHLGMAVVDAINHYLTARGTDGSIKLGIDLDVAERFLGEMKREGYGFEKIGVQR